MKIAIITGSHRKKSESERIGRYIESEVKKLGQTPWLFSLSNNPLPLWDEGTWSGDEKWTKIWSPISKELQEADGVVVVSPEWSGMVPAGLKNFFLLCQGGELAHKAGLIVAISSGIGGAYPVNELRTSSYKNTRFCYMPDHVIIRECESMLKEATPANHHDESIRKRLTYSLQVLFQYSSALKGVRESGVINTKDFPYGM